MLAIAKGQIGQVLIRPLFLKVKQNSILQKASNKQKYYGYFWTCSACYITIWQMKKYMMDAKIFDATQGILFCKH